MAGFPDYGYRNESKRIAAWTAHYMAKGCFSRKAHGLAMDKVHRSQTWPSQARDARES